MPSSTIEIPLVDNPAYTPRKLRVVTIGAGLSGLTFAHKIQHAHPELQDFISHTTFEALDEVGGTWKVNTYPGVQCDVPAHVYVFPFDPNPNWSKFYADGDEIQDYIRGVCDRWDLRRNIQFNTKVLDAEWIEEESQWKLMIEKKGEKEIQEVYADVVISGLGNLSRWRWPNIPGIHDFKGHKVHSADWIHDYDYSHKRIGMIGNGSSAIQILPKMAELEGTDIVSLQRGPTWITPSLGAAIASEQKNDDDENSQEGDDEEELGKGSISNPNYTKRDKQRFSDPDQHKEYRKMLQVHMAKGFRLFRKDSDINKQSTKWVINYMSKKLNNDPELCAKLIPKWTLGCRRLTPGEGYLESFLRPNVHLTNSPIVRITETGIQTEAEHHDIDVLICATGFDCSNIPLFPVTGRGVTLAEKWKDEPESYLSVCCPDFPNWFIFTGPNATVGHGSLTPSLDWTAEYMIKWLKKMAAENVKSIAPKQSATDEFVRYGDRIHNTLTWTGGCSSWYKNHRVNARVTATFPGSALLYRTMVQELRPEDFEIKYASRNRFSFMGNGYTSYELDDANDLAFYMVR